MHARRNRYHTCIRNARSVGSRRLETRCHLNFVQQPTTKTALEQRKFRYSSVPLKSRASSSREKYESSNGSPQIKKISIAPISSSIPINIESRSERIVLDAAYIDRPCIHIQRDGCAPSGNWRTIRVHNLKTTGQSDPRPLITATGLNPKLKAAR